MAKHPVPGRVKTRLATVIGAEAACRLYRAFIRDLAARLATTPWPVTWAVWPADSPFETVVPGARCVPQEGATLGTRMAHATAQLFTDSRSPVVVLGADSPHLPLAAVADAGRALCGDVDVALGPTVDGGYWLIGLRAPRPELFDGIAWSTATVLHETLARVRAGGLRVHLAPATFDVDEPADLTALRALLARGDITLPRTAAVLATLP
jgi:rSAM/selenodomain-associated transferase 1